VPTAGGEALEARRARRGVIEMERLRIEFGGEALDGVRLDRESVRAEFLADGEVLEMARRAHAANSYAAMLMLPSVKPWLMRVAFGCAPAAP
jgi:hypothetical protein